MHTHLVTIMENTKPIRVSLAVYRRLCELGKTNDSFVEIVDRLFKENNLFGVVTEDDKTQ